jgi:hypothetical protein
MISSASINTIHYLLCSAQQVAPWRCFHGNLPCALDNGTSDLVDQAHRLGLLRVVYAYVHDIVLDLATFDVLGWNRGVWRT